MRVCDHRHTQRLFQANPIAKKNTEKHVTHRNTHTHDAVCTLKSYLRLSVKCFLEQPLPEEEAAYRLYTTNSFAFYFRFLCVCMFYHVYVYSSFYLLAYV